MKLTIVAARTINGRNKYFQETEKLEKDERGRSNHILKSLPLLYILHPRFVLVSSLLIFIIVKLINTEKRPK